MPDLSFAGVMMLPFIAVIQTLNVMDMYDYVIKDMIKIIKDTRINVR